MSLTIGIEINQASRHELPKVVEEIVCSQANEKEVYRVELSENRPNTEDIQKYISAIHAPVVDEGLVVGLIYHFDQISELNQNKLLKTIEDNKKQLQIFIYEDETKLIPTIKSRLLKYRVANHHGNQDSFTEFAHYFQENPDQENLAHMIEKYLKQNKYKQAYILATLSQEKIEKEDVQINLSLILNHLFEIKEYDVFTQVQALESRIHNSVNPEFILDQMYSILIGEM